IEVDMLPPDHKRQKLMTPGQNYDNFHMSIQLGYQPQYMRNTLQLNRGKQTDGRILFSEMAFMAGVAKTDWSWAPLFADFDNDGFKDLFIANGYRKDVTNLDFIFFGMEKSPFGTDEGRLKKYYNELDKLEKVQTTNHIFQNNGSLGFNDKTVDWGVSLPTYSNGAAYADLDNDGDLDLVTNNIDQEVVVYENTMDKRSDKNHFIRLTSKEGNVQNQKIWVYTKGICQFQELTPYRGFQSSVVNYAHFGVGQNEKIDSIIIQWTDDVQLKFKDVKADTILTFTKSTAQRYQFEEKVENATWFEKVSIATYRHKETSAPDIKNTRTLLHELSRYGPCLASGDVNGDNLDDFFIGGESGSASRLFIQQNNGRFSSTSFNVDSTREDGGALFFDADGDGDLDLYVAGASPSSTQSASLHQTFINDGKGKFSISTLLPEIKVSASCIASADYDGDGDLDLFVGARFKPNEYPFNARSYILRNDREKFKDVTAQLNSQLENPGLINSAVWADIDRDEKPDLVLAGEWMPIRIFINKESSFEELTEEFGLGKTNGWWNCVKAADLNADGYVDIIAGNTGTNSYFKPTPEHPVEIVAKDFDKNGSIDPIVTYFNPIDDNRFMVHNRLVVIDQIPSIKKRFETFTQFATTPFEKAFSKEERADAMKAHVNSLSSNVLMNNGGKSFSARPLPEIAQLSTINDILTEDVNEDKHVDIVLIGNNYAQETLFGRYDASIGTILLGDGKGGWKNLEARTSGFLAEGNAKYIRSLRGVNRNIYIIVNNNDSLDCFVVHKTGK
ncbi:MAG TPA: FG-GAP-like repeat-containing protein, partial [Chryseolinea sp.]|nr:FG-GAP-like repeat-containing protein [Chryseolinea sp.]